VKDTRASCARRGNPASRNASSLRLGTQNVYTSLEAEGSNAPISTLLAIKVIGAVIEVSGWRKNRITR
jgi:hypothetical protein